MGKNFVNNSGIKIYLFLVKYSWSLLLSPLPLFSHFVSFPISFAFLIPHPQSISCRRECLKTTLPGPEHSVGTEYLPCTSVARLFCPHRSGTSLKAKYLFSHSLPQVIDTAHFCWLLIYGLNNPSQHNLQCAKSYLCLVLIHLVIA